MQLVLTYRPAAAARGPQAPSSTAPALCFWKQNSNLGGSTIYIVIAFRVLGPENVREQRYL